MSRKPRALFVLTSHDDLGGVRKTGYFVDEAAHPWKVLTDACVEVDFASIEGGNPPIDGRDESNAEQNAFLSDPDVAPKLADTPALEDVDPADYDAVLFVGGHGTVWDFPHDEAVGRVGRGVWEDGGVVAAVCHGPSALIGLTLSDGTALIEGKRVAGFSNAEEEAVGLTQVVPYLLADALKAQGATHTEGDVFTEHVEVDGRLVTGQNPQSATKVGEEMARLLTSS